jgi:DnaJ-class molecular chaperone
MFDQIRAAPQVAPTPHVCEHCEGKGWLVRDPYGNLLPCSECDGRGVIFKYERSK